MKILIADDEPLIRRSLEKVFERAGHQCLLAEDGHKALEIWQGQAPEAVILDVLMPGLTGPEVLSEMGDTSKTPILLISAYTGDYDLHKAKSLGADLFIEKPFDDLPGLVDQVLQLHKDKLA